jgi:hypothetical protein
MKRLALIVCLVYMSGTYAAQSHCRRVLLARGIVVAPIVVPALYYSGHTSDDRVEYLPTGKYETHLGDRANFGTGVVAGAMAPPICIYTTAIRRTTSVQDYRDVYSLVTSDKALCAGFIGGLSPYITLPVVAKMILRRGR